jgi:hypothetical protein
MRRGKIRLSKTEKRKKGGRRRRRRRIYALANGASRMVDS